MNKLFFTITGCSFRYGLDFFRPGMPVTLIKEPDNRFDHEAIRVELDGLGTVGYVANSPATVRGISMSAGRLYDKIPGRISATVQYVLPDSVIALVDGQAGSEGETEGPAAASGTEDLYPFTEYTADIDIYSDEDLHYLEPAENEEEDQEESGSRTEEDVLLEEEPAGGSVEPEDFASLRDTVSLSDTVSAEDIASALTAALSGLAAGFTDRAEEDPDEEYIYGKRAAVSPVVEEPSDEAASEPEPAASSSGLTAVDFASILAGRDAGSSAERTDSAPPAVDSVPPAVNEETEEAVNKKTEEAVQEEEDIPAPAVAYIDDAGSSDSPGLSFNNARFPEEMDGYSAPASAKPVTADEPAEEEENPPLSSAEEDGIPSEEEAPLFQTGSEEDDAEGENDSAEEAEEQADPEADADPGHEEGSGGIGETAPEISGAAGEAGEIEEAADEVPSTASDEEEYDYSQDRFQFDESDLDDNLSQLHLEDIDATYLPENFLENLKKRLRESSH